MRTDPFVVLLTGHPASGKSTLATPLAEALGAVCLSKDQVRYRVFDGWKPDHPGGGGRALTIGRATFDEDDVVWSTWFWAIEQALAVVPVVAETAMTRDVNRADVARFLDRLGVPTVEVLLRSSLPALLERYAARQASAEAHRVYRRFPPGTENPLLAQEYRPLLAPSRVIEVDATDPSTIDAVAVAAYVRAMVGSP